MGTDRGATGDMLLVRLSIAVVQDLFSPGFFWSREGGVGGEGGRH